MSTICRAAAFYYGVNTLYRMRKTETDLFTHLKRELTRIPKAKGEVQDDRLDRLRFVETARRSGLAMILPLQVLLLGCRFGLLPSTHLRSFPGLRRPPSPPPRSRL